MLDKTNQSLINENLPVLKKHPIASMYRIGQQLISRKFQLEYDQLPGNILNPPPRISLHEKSQKINKPPRGGNSRMYNMVEKALGAPCTRE